MPDPDKVVQMISNQDEVQYNDPQESQLFLIRLWTAAGTAGNDGSPVHATGDRIEWLGKLQHVVSGETHYVRDWPSLINLMLEIARTSNI